MKTKRRRKAVVRRLSDLSTVREAALKQQRQEVIRKLRADGEYVSYPAFAKRLGVDSPLKLKDIVLARKYALNTAQLERLRRICNSVPSKPNWRVFADPRIQDLASDTAPEIGQPHRTFTIRGPRAVRIPRGALAIVVLFTAPQRQ